jgi:hypothetical protein
MILWSLARVHVGSCFLCCHLATGKLVLCFLCTSHAHTEPQQQQRRFSRMASTRPKSTAGEKRSFVVCFMPVRTIVRVLCDGLDSSASPLTRTAQRGGNVGGEVWRVAAAQGIQALDERWYRSCFLFFFFFPLLVPPSQHTIVVCHAFLLRARVCGDAYRVRLFVADASRQKGLSTPSSSTWMSLWGICRVSKQFFSTFIGLSLN